MSMNDKLYNELLDYCAGDLYEVERTLKYFQSRLDSDLEAEAANELEGDEEDDL